MIDWDKLREGGPFTACRGCRTTDLDEQGRELGACCHACAMQVLAPTPAQAGAALVLHCTPGPRRDKERRDKLAGMRRDLVLALERAPRFAPIRRR